MPSDGGQRSGDPNTAFPPSPSQHAGRLDRPLGRGLEDVSHLFLSGGADNAGSRLGSDVRSVLLRPHAGFSRERLTAVLRDFDGALEDGMRGIDSNVPCEPFGEIDVIALDRVNQLTIIDVDTTPNDGLLLRGISHLGWVLGNMGLVRRMYQGQRVNFSLQPRLVLVAPSYSPLFGSVARQITSHTRLLTYRVVDVPGGTGLLLEPVGDQ
jgi:hypothetical protein